MIKENYIFFDIDAKNKEEALDFVSSKAFEYGITDDKDGLLGDFLKREEEYSTGLQDEFAIPHAKSTHAKEVAIFFVKCKMIQRLSICLHLLYQWKMQGTNTY